MSRFVLLPFTLCICVTVLFCFSSRLFSQDQGLQSAKILEVTPHLEGRMVNYANETSAPVYDRYPFYDLKVQVGSDCYVARYSSQTTYFPEGWKSGSTVQTRMDAGMIYLVRYDGVEVPIPVLGRCQA
jgi:hypothetical protein